ncbi:MAG: MFS transporter [Steroidobacteraceae bacterium]
MNRTSVSGVAPGRASARFIAIYATAYATLWLALLTPAIISLALRIQQLAPANAAKSISWVLMTGALVALVSNPVFGALSDRTRSRFGRRRPWLVGGVLCGCAALAVIGLAPTVNIVLLGWCLAQLAYNAVLASLVAIIPDRIPPAQRGTVVGILGVCMPVGQITGTYLVQLLAFNTTWMLVVPGLIGMAGVLLLVFVLPEEVRAADYPAGMHPATPVPAPAALSQPPDHRDFSWAWLSRVLFTTGSSFLQAYQPLFLLEKLGFDPADVPRLIFRSTLVGAVMVVVWSLIAGRLSDRTGRRKPFVMAGSVIQGLGLWLIATSSSYTMLLFGVALTGMGHGVYEGVDLALVTDVLPDRDQHAAKDLGLLNIANTLPQVIAPLCAPLILAVSHGDYTLLFAVAGAVAVLGAAVLAPLKKVR